MTDVPLVVLIPAYVHVHVAELLLAGVPARQAYDAAGELLYVRLQSRAARNMIGRMTVILDAASAGQHAGRAIGWTMQGVHQMRGATDRVPEAGPARHATNKCANAVLARTIAALSSPDPWHDYLASATPVVYARSVLPASDLAALLWHLDTMRMVGTGGAGLLTAATIAHDRATGRRHARKTPADPVVLARHVDVTLTAVWESITTAVDEHGAPWWTTVTLDADRPVAAGLRLHAGH